MGFSALLATADRAALKHLGEEVSYAPSAGAPVVVRGIFDAVHVRVDVGEAGVTSSGPALFLRLADLPSAPSEDDATVTVAGVQYRIREAQPDGQGSVLLLLHRV